MGRVKDKLRWVKRYLKRTGRLKTLVELDKDIKEKLKKDDRESSKPSFKITNIPDRKNKEDRHEKKDKQKRERVDESLTDKKQTDDNKPVKLSFTIQKAPERTKIKIEPSKPKKRELKKDAEEPKTVTIPKDFKKIAKKFGLPEDHLEFFYEHRESFNWEFKRKFVVHCTEPGCKLTVNETKGCLNEHMISIHNYIDIPCGKTDCSYVAYSQKNLNLHHSRFHGHGQKPTNNALHTCPYSSCKIAFGETSSLRFHVNTHKNIVFSCNFCPYRAVKYINLSLHLKLHFNIKDFQCDICSRPFPNLGNLNMHKKATHNTDGFDCQDCSFTCQKYDSFIKHRKSCAERLKHSRLL